jgi:alpha,alpha-trehalase
MKLVLSRLFAVVALCLISILTGFSQTVPVMDNLWRLVAQEDTDGDSRITVHDRTTPFEVRDQNGMTVCVVSNEYSLSVLLQELKRAEDNHHDEISMSQIPLNESVVDRTHRLIKEFYWDALTRRIDADHLDQVIHDPKVVAKCDYIYVPASDKVAARYFQTLEKTATEQHRSPPLKVVLLPAPDKITGEFVRNLDGEHGLLSLKLELDARGQPVHGVPYVVPGGRFNELYYWDSYFITLGLLQDGRTNLACGMADNLLYEMEHYGKIPNANRTYYLTRSQPLFLTSIIRAVYDSGTVNRQWLASALKIAVDEYRNVWLGKDRLVSIGPYQLSRYYDSGSGPCPEVEPGHYDEKIHPWLDQVDARNNDEPLTPFGFLNEYLYCGEFANLTADGLTLNGFFKNDRAERESGHDTTHRFDDRATDFVSVDLNSLLYKYETDFADLLETEFGGKLPSLGTNLGDATFWRRQAQARKQAMMALMWDDQRGFFFDYDFVNLKRSTYISATGLYPLWAKLLDAHDPTGRERLARMVSFTQAHLEEPAGLAASAEESVTAARDRDPRQWDYPYGWPPHQMLAWQGLKNYGLDAEAGRLAYRWLYTIAKNAHDYDGVIPEKYNVVTGSHEVFVEYGNVGTKFQYITPEGFGWMNASFEVGLSRLSPNQLADLRALKPPPPVK